MKQVIEVGECFAIPVELDKIAYGQYVYDHPLMGCLVRVLGTFTSQLLTLVELHPDHLLFPPVFVGLIPPIRSKRWITMGHLPVLDFVFPQFRTSFTRIKGVNHDWRVWDGHDYTWIGDLPAELRSLEILGGWSYVDLEERIRTGKNWVADGIL